MINSQADDIVAVIRKGEIALIGVTWIYILLYFAYLIICGHISQMLIPLSCAALNGVKTIGMKLLFQKEDNAYTITQNDKVWYLLRALDLLLVSFIVFTLDVQGNILFVFLIIPCFFLYEQSKKPVLAMMVLFDASYFSIIFFNTIKANSNIELLNYLIIKIIFVVILQIALSSYIEKVIATFNEKNILLMNLKNTFREAEKAQKMLQEKTLELESNKMHLEEKNEKLSKNVAELYTMQEVSKFITSTLNIDELLNLINDMILGIMGVNYSAILMRNYDDEDKLEVVVSNIKDKAQNEERLKIFKDVIDQVFISKVPVLNTNESMKILTEYNIGSVLSVPLIIKGELIGISIAAHQNKEALTGDSLKFLSSIFNQVSIAMENAKLYREMKNIAEIDGLTRVYNRLYFQQKYAEYRKNPQINKLGVAIIDIDHFKNFNDTYGHQFGDIVLQKIVAIGKEFLEENEFIARYGGEEFAIIFENKEEDYVVKKIEQIRKVIEKTKISNGVFKASVTASFGVAFYPATYNGCDEHLITCADNALYESKKNGRNRVTVAEEEKTGGVV